MNKLVKQTLQTLAYNLPALVDDKVNEIRIVTGKKIIEEWQDKTKEPQLSSGEHINPNKRYSYSYPKPIDHYKNLVEVWKKYGQKGVDEYRETINRIYAESLAKQSQAQNNDNKESNENKDNQQG